MDHGNPTIAIDMDGVLCEEPQFEHIERLNAVFGTTYKPADIKYFDYFKFMPPAQAKFMFSKNCWHREDLYDNTPLLPEKLAVLEELREIGEVICITSPLVGHVRSKLEWLLKYFHRRDIYLASNKTRIPADILIDDSIENLEEWPAYGICYTQPWNESYAAHYRVDKFSELPDMVNHIIEVDRRLGK